MKVKVRKNKKSPAQVQDVKREVKVKIYGCDAMTSLVYPVIPSYSSHVSSISVTR